MYLKTKGVLEDSGRDAGVRKPGAKWQVVVKGKIKEAGEVLIPPPVWREEKSKNGIFMVGFEASP